MEEQGNEEEKINLMEGLSLTKVSDVIDALIEKEDMKELKILKDRMIKYKEEVESKIIDKKPIEHESFKKHLFRNLEKNLLFSIYIKNPEMRKEKIRKTYLWFFERLQKWNSLDKIKYRTDKNVDEKYKPEEIASDDIIIKDDEYELNEFRLHRTDIPGLEPPKQRLSEFKTKQVKPPARFKKDKITMDDLRFNIDRFHGRVGSANYMVKMKPDKFYEKTGNLWFNPSGIPVNEDNRPIDMRKEIKSAYSYNRPSYQIEQLNIEKKINKAKNIELREKRSQDEIKKYMEEAAMARAKYKEKREIKFNTDNIVKEYEKTFKTDKDAEELIEEQNKIEENNKDSKENDFKNINSSYKGPLNNADINNNANDDNNNNLINENDRNKSGLNATNKSGANINNNVELKKISSKFPNCFSNINNKIVYSKIENKNDLISNEEKEKMKNKENNNDEEANAQDNNNNVNIDDLILDKQENNFKLALKANKDELFEKIKKDQDKTFKIKYDTVALNVVNDRVLKARIQSAKICSVKEIAPKKMDYVQYYIPLSSFDELNYQTYTEKFTKPKPKHTRPRTASEYALRNFKKYENNYLALRKEMTKFYGQEKENMNKMLFEKMEQEKDDEDKEKEKEKEKEKGKNLNSSSKGALPTVGRGKSVGRVMSAAINLKRDGLLFNNTFERMFDRPLEGPPRSIYYLPKTELGLLKKPPPIKGKKKKKKKKKKKF